MNTMDHCERLDDYLDGELTPDEASRFLAHAESCGDCRANVDAMAEFDGLVAEAKTAIDEWYAENSDRGKQDAYPTSAVVRPERSVASRLLASFAVVAATIAIAIVFVARKIENRWQTLPTPHEVVESPKGDSTTIPQPNPVTTRLSNINGYLAEPLATENPNITIYWLHPTSDSVAAKDEADSSAIPDQDKNLLARRI